MNAPILNTESIDVYRELLPEGFEEETRKRKELLNTNRKETTERLEVVNKSCGKMVSEFSSLEKSFANNSRSYARLERANKTNHQAYVNLRDQLNELSRQLKEGGKSIRQSCCDA